MKKKEPKPPFTKYEKEERLKKEFESLCTDGRSTYQVWEDMVRIFACVLANIPELIIVHPQEKRSRSWHAREEGYKKLITRYSAKEQETLSMIFAHVGEYIHETGDDILGNLYMALDLGNHYKGQYFTPSNVAEAMARMMCTKKGVEKAIEKQGFESILDPCCGGGVLLMAAAKVLKEEGVDVANDVLFVGQDIDWVVAMMTYIQLSIAGCAGYVCIGNSLTGPFNDNILLPKKGEGYAYWYTPYWYAPSWQARKQAVRQWMAEQEG